MTIREDLINKGYFPENLPPLFSTRSFGEFIRNKVASNVYLTHKVHRTRPALYNASKRGHQRRTFSIPSPIAASDVESFIGLHWPEMQVHFHKSNISASLRVWPSETSRAISITTHDDLEVLKATRLATSRFVVSTDISRFYPSIYTHALPWAYHGKDASKIDYRPTSRNVFFNRLDYILRQAQDGQTMGIPVGPDSSRIIAELVAVAVDELFPARWKGARPPIIRHVDDIWIGAKTRDEAERALYAYRSCLREFELDINELKTFTTEATKMNESFWPKELGDLLGQEFAEQGYRISSRPHEKILVLDRVFERSEQYRDDGIVKYALRRLDEMRAWDRNWSIVEDFLLKCSINFPHSIDYVARVLAWRRRTGKPLDEKRWGHVLSELLSYHAGLRNDSEVCWSLWLARELRKKLQKNVYRAVQKNCGPLCLMMLYELADTTATPVLPSDDLLERLQNRPLHGSLWLFAYEGARRGWLDEKAVRSAEDHQIFGQMFLENVSFLDRNALPVALEGREENRWD